MTSIRVVLFVLCPFIATMLWSGEAHACKCERNIKPVADSKIVFWGTPKDIRPRGAQDRVTFEIAQLYKGDEERSEITVHTNRFHHDCGVRFEQGKSYMVYAYDFYPRGVATSLCWGTREQEEAVSEDEWTKISVAQPVDTPLEVELRKIALKVVPECGASQRLFNTGFSMVLSPDGDPVLKQQKPTPGPKHAAFQSCVLANFLQSKDLLRPETATIIHGWYQRDVRGLPVLLDEEPCGEDCRDFSAILLEPLMMPKPPSDDSFKNRLFQEWDECLEGGIPAVGEESPGSASQQQRRNRMLAECGAQRGEYESAQPFVDSIDNDALRHAIAWAIANGSKDAPTPITGQTYPAAAYDGEATDEGLRKLRAGFIGDAEWSFSTIYLQALAQALLEDDEATDRMRDLASLALFRASLIDPKAKDAFQRLAREASATPAAGELQTALQQAWDAAHAPPVVEEAPVEVAEQAPVEDEPEPRDPMILVIAGVLIAVALGGIGAILKRRN